VPAHLAGRAASEPARSSRRAGVAAAALAAVAVSLPATAGNPPRLVDPHPCRGAPGFTCSTLAVPLDRAGRLPGTLRLAVAAADGRRAPKGVLLVLTGGPGQPGVEFAPRLASKLAPALRDYRLVLYDQRGTGATALRCPALQKAMGGSDLYPPAAGAVRSCAAGIGAARRLYGTDDVVADMEALRRALGVETWTLDGISYGTYVAERYAIAHPARARGLVLDSVVPHEAGPALIPEELRASARVLRLACRGTRCPGDPAADLARVVRARHDGPELLSALTLLSIVDPTYRKIFDIPALLHRARSGDTAGLDRFLATARRWSAAPAGELSQGLHAAALCGDWRFPWGASGAPLVGRSAALRRFAARQPASRLWPYDHATLTGNGFVRQCLPWPPTQPTPAPARARLPAVPTLLLAGDRDLSTPLAWARREAALAPKGRLVVVPGAGHSVQSRAVSDAGRRAVATFLAGLPSR
jgi:pimeloyl-ACP methyl ester carboxylesterase